MSADNHSPQTVQAKEPASSASVEEIIRKRLEDERARLMDEMQVAIPVVEQFDRPVERDFTRAEREHTTILFGGLTWKHEQLIRGALEGLGYKVRAARHARTSPPSSSARSTATTASATRPTSPSATSCSTCRSSRRRACPARTSSTTTCSSPPARAARAGSACTKPSTAWRCATPASTASACCSSSSPAGSTSREADAGLEMNVDFFLAILNAMNMGDLAQRRRLPDPPVRDRGGRDRRACSTRRWTSCDEVFRTRAAVAARRARCGSLMKMTLGGTADIRRQVPRPALRRRATSTRSEDVARQARRRRGRPHPRQAHRQDHRRVLGADHRGRRQLQHVPVPRARGRAGARRAGRHLDHVHDPPGQADEHGPRGRRRTRRRCRRRGASTSAWRELRGPRKKNAQLTLAEAIFKREWNRLRDALGGIPHELTDQYELQRIGAPATTTRAPAAARATSRSPRTSTTRTRTCATWCCPSSRSGACPPRSPTASSPRSSTTTRT